MWRARRRPRPGLIKSPVAGEAPGTVDEDTHADPLALDVVDLVDAPVLGRDQLRPPNDRAGVRVGRASGKRRGDSFFAERSHGRNPNGPFKILGPDL